MIRLTFIYFVLIFLTSVWTFWHLIWQTPPSGSWIEKNLYCMDLYLIALTQIVLCFPLFRSLCLNSSDSVCRSHLEIHFLCLVSRRILTTLRMNLFYFIFFLYCLCKFHAIYHILLNWICQTLLFSALPSRTHLFCWIPNKNKGTIHPKFQNTYFSSYV